MQDTQTGDPVALRSARMEGGRVMVSSPAEATRRGHRTASSRRHRSIHGRLQAEQFRRRLRRWVLRGMAALFACSTVVLTALLWRSRTELRDLGVKLRNEAELERLKAQQSMAAAAEQQREAERLRGELDAVVRGRLPRPLLEMVPDTLIRLEQAPLRSILFTRVGTADRPGYEYTLTCSNESAEASQPRYRILLFNAVGIQTGMADSNDHDGASRLGGSSSLAPGESRSFSGRVRLQFAGVPKYFLVLKLGAEGQVLLSTPEP